MNGTFIYTSRYSVHTHAHTPAITNFDFDYQLHLKQQRYSGQCPFRWFIFRFQIERPHIGWTTRSRLVHRTFVHIPQILFVLCDCLQKQMDNTIIRTHWHVKWNRKCVCSIFTRTLMTGIAGNNSFNRDSIMMPACVSHRAPSMNIPCT